MRRDLVPAAGIFIQTNQCECEYSNGSGRRLRKQQSTQQHAPLPLLRLVHCKAASNIRSLELQEAF